MKIWHAYGSEHSANLVMIGHFKTIEDAQKVHRLIEQLSNGLEGKIEVGTPPERFSDEVLDLLRATNCHVLGPTELEQFFSDVNMKVESDKIVLTTDELEISAFFKLMIDGGARIEVYSAHDYPDADYGRGK